MQLPGRVWLAVRAAASAIGLAMCCLALLFILPRGSPVEMGFAKVRIGPSRQLVEAMRSGSMDVVPSVRRSMLSELGRQRQRLAQAHEPWNVDSSPLRRGRGGRLESPEKRKYYQLQKERYDRGESSLPRYPADDPYPLDATWGMAVRSPGAQPPERLIAAGARATQLTQTTHSSDDTQPLSRDQYQKQLGQHGMVWYGVP